MKTYIVQKNIFNTEKILEDLSGLVSLWEEENMEISLSWLIVGFLGQLFFSARFIVQWIYSEINKKTLLMRSQLVHGCSMKNKS